MNADIERGLTEKERETNQLTSALASAHEEMAQLRASGEEAESWKRKADAFDQIMEQKQTIRAILHQLKQSIPNTPH